MQKYSFYVAGSFTNKDVLLKIMEDVESKGFVLSSNWTNHKPIKPYIENSKLASTYVKEDIDAAGSCDVFVLIPDKEGGTTQFGELGVAIISDKVKHVFVVGENNQRSMLFFHPRVTRVKSMKEVYSLIENK